MIIVIKKVYKGRVYHNNATEENRIWFFYGLNTKTKKIKPQVQNKKSKIWSLLFFIINIIAVGVVLGIQINSEEGVSSISNVFNNEHHIVFFVLAIACFLVSEFCIAIRLYILSKKFNKKSSFEGCLKGEFVCQYYSKITPFAVGGQPFQVYVLNRHGIKANNAITTVSCNYVSQKLVYWFVALFMMATIGTNALVKDMSGSAFQITMILAGVSLGFMSIFLTFVILVCVNKKIASNLVAFIIKILYKLKIVKDRKKMYFKIMRPALSFQHKMKIFFTSRKFALLTLLFSLVIYLMQCCIPACIYFIFKPFDITIFWQLLSIAVIIQLSFGVNPIPGGTGVAELSFYAVFTLLIDKSLVFWALIIWRVLTYYIYLIIGICIVIYDYSYGNRKYRKRLQKTKNNE